MLLKFPLTVGVCLFAAAPFAHAQQPLTLAAATGRALERNRDIRVEREQVAAAE
jgi:outer membrane protein TolC